MDLIWTAEDRFTVDGVAFVCSHGESTPDLFCIRKPRPLVDATVALAQRVHPDRIVEIGIASGAFFFLREISRSFSWTLAASRL